MAAEGLLVSIAKAFEEGGEELFKKEKSLRELLSTNKESSNPTILAEYQAVVSEVTILRNAQSSTVKVMKDMDATIVANFR